MEAPTKQQKEIENISDPLPEQTMEAAEQARKWGMKAVHIVITNENGEQIQSIALRRLRWTGEFAF
jgi:hypothetical protein